MFVEHKFMVTKYISIFCWAIKCDQLLFPPKNLSSVREMIYRC